MWQGLKVMKMGNLLWWSELMRDPSVWEFSKLKTAASILPNRTTRHVEVVQHYIRAREWKFITEDLQGRENIDHRSSIIDHRSPRSSLIAMWKITVSAAHNASFDWSETMSIITKDCIQFGVDSSACQALHPEKLNNEALLGLFYWLTLTSWRLMIT
jgi:hypothetical protein